MRDGATPPGSLDADFYEDLHVHVSRVVARVCPTWLRADRDDIIQVAMMRLHQVIQGAEERTPFSSSYIWRTAFSVTVDEIRRRTRRPETPIEDAPAAMAMIDGAPGPDAQAVSRELGRALRACLSRLSIERRDAVVLYLQGHAVAEIATLLGWKAKRADNLVYRGLADLRGCMSAKGMTAL